MDANYLKSIAQQHTCIGVSLSESSPDDYLLLVETTVLEDVIAGRIVPSFEGEKWLIVPVENVFAVSFGSARHNWAAVSSKKEVPDKSPSWLEGAQSLGDLLYSWQASGQIVTIKTSAWTYWGKIIRISEHDMIISVYDRDDLVLGDLVWIKREDIETVRFGENSEKMFRKLEKMIARLDVK